MAPPEAGAVAAPRIVLDTNVLLDLWVFADPAVAPLAAALAAGRLQPVRSAATDGELRAVLARPTFALPPERQAELVADWLARAVAIDAPPVAGLRCRDPLDQKFVELAVAAGARFLVTRDRALLALARRARDRGIAVLAPGGFAAALSEVIGA
jgi:predicted nucleic acid-binding protein